MDKLHIDTKRYKTAEEYTRDKFPNFDDVIYNVIEMLYDKGLTKEEILQQYQKVESDENEAK